MPRCYVLPGIVSSELETFELRASTVWVSYTDLGLGLVGKMRLAADGVQPGTPDGLFLVGGQPLPKVWETPLKLLADQLRPHGYEVVGVGFDWRKTIREAGRRLAARIRSEVQTSDPCAIVGHSQGGLVARACWWELGQTNEQGLIRRIVTLGTPHWGSYAAVLLLGGVSEIFDGVIALNQLVTGLQQAPIPPFLRTLLSRDDLVSVAASWPAVYELFPCLQSPESGDDPLRSRLFDKANWSASSPVSQDWLTYARDVWQPWLRSAETVPPPHVLTYLAGQDVWTASVLDENAALGTGKVTAYSEPGDGTVSQASATLGSGPGVLWAVRHADMPLAGASAGVISGLVLEVRNPPDPVPPPTTIVPQSPALQTWPPRSLPIMSQPYEPRCGSGRCHC